MFLPFIKLLFTWLNYKCHLISDLVEFTDEEGYGKYLDLNECYEKYINLKGIEVSRVTYYQVLKFTILIFIFNFKQDILQINCCHSNVVVKISSERLIFTHYKL